jgi:hypothetical protein
MTTGASITKPEVEPIWIARTGVPGAGVDPEQHLPDARVLPERGPDAGDLLDAE